MATNVQPVPGRWVFHHTSTAAAQQIALAGVLQPGRGGVLYFTWDLFSSGAEAADRLSIIGKPVEAMIAIDRQAVELIATGSGDDLTPQVVRPIRLGLQGELIRRGGGAEITLAGKVAVNPLRLYSMLMP
jgi:hypothetical protein